MSEELLRDHDAALTELSAWRTRISDALEMTVEDYGTRHATLDEALAEIKRLREYWVAAERSHVGPSVTLLHLVEAHGVNEGWLDGVALERWPAFHQRLHFQPGGPVRG